MRFLKSNLKKVAFFITTSTLYCLFFNMVYTYSYATDGGTSTSKNAEVYKEVPYIAKYIIQWDFVISSAGSLLWLICLGLIWLLNGVYDGITGIFGVIGKMFTDTEIGKFFTQFNVLIFPLLLVCLALYGLYAVFFGAKKMKPLAKGFVVITGTLLFASTIIGMISYTTQDIATTISVDSKKCGKLSFGSCIAKDYIVDVPYYASQKNENGNRNNIKTNEEMFGLRYNEGIGPDYEISSLGKKDLNIPTEYDENGNVVKALGLKTGDWWKLGTDYVSYQKWNINFIGLLIVALVLIFSLLGSGFRIGIIVFDGVLVSGLLPVVGATDIGGGQKIKNAVKMIFMGFANIVLYIIGIKFFGEFVLMIQKLNINWLSQVFLIGGGAISVFNLPTTLARIFNIMPPKEGNVLQRLLIADRLLNKTQRRMPKFNKNSGGNNDSKSLFSDNAMRGNNNENNKQQFSNNMDYGKGENAFENKGNNNPFVDFNNHLSYSLNLDTNNVAGNSKSNYEFHQPQKSDKNNQQEIVNVNFDKFSQQINNENMSKKNQEFSSNLNFSQINELNELDFLKGSDM